MCDVYPNAAIASPDPCISNRVLVNNDGTITVLTSSASTWALFTASPAEVIQILINDVEVLNLHQGIDNSLDATLGTAMNSLQDMHDQNTIAANNSLEAFINAVIAQRGNKIPENEADKLIAAARGITVILNE